MTIEAAIEAIVRRVVREELAAILTQLQPRADMPKVLTRKEAAAALRVTTRGLDRMIARGDLKTVKVGQKRMVPREAVRRALGTGD